MSRPATVSPRKAAPPKSRRIARLLRPMVRFPLRSAAAACAGAMCVLIVVNAVGLQTARHPSPWFGRPSERADRPLVQADAARSMSVPAMPQTGGTPRPDINSLLEPRKASGVVPVPRPKLPPG